MASQADGERDAEGAWVFCDGKLAMYLRAGFEFEGCWRRHILGPDGVRIDVHWVAMFRETWNARRDELADALLGGGE